MDAAGSADAAQAAATPQPAGRRRRRGRFGLWLLASVLLIVSVLGFAVMGLTGKTIRLPVWAVAEAEARINRGLDMGGRVQVSLGGADIRVDGDWVPRLRLEDVRLLQGGTSLLTLPEARIAFDPGAVTEGKIRVRRLQLVGAQAVLRRDADGRFDLELGGGAAAGNVDSLAALLDQVDAVFAMPALSHLRRIEAEALTLTLRDDRAGRVWEMGDGRFALDNEDDRLSMELGVSLVAGGEAPAQATLTFVSEKGSTAARINATVNGVAARDLATQAAPLAFLSVLDAPLSGRLSAGIDTGGSVASLDGALEIAAGSLKPTDDTNPLGFERAALQFAYDPQAERIDFSEIAIDSPSLRLAASGRVYVPGIASGIANEFIAQVSVGQLLVDQEGVFAEPVRFSQGAADLRLRLNPFSLDIGQVALVEEGRHLHARGRATAEAEGWALSLDLGLNRIGHDNLLALWPVRIVPRTRAWLVENVQEGELFDVKASLRIHPERAPRLSLVYEFADADVRFLKTLPPIRRGHGYATIEGQAYTMVLDRGQVTPEKGGTIRMAGSVFSVPDVTRRPAIADIRLKTDSTITAALSLLDEPPFNFMTKAGRPVDLAEGRARIDTRIKVPLIPKVQIGDVTYDVAGELTGVTSSVLVPGRVLRADRLTLTADREGMTIAGPGRIGEVAFDAAYRQGFTPDQKGRSRVNGTVELSQATIREFNIGLPEGMAEGRGRGSFDIGLVRDEAPRLLLTSDLRGLAVAIPALGWRKPAEAAGRLEVAARLGKTPAVDRIEIEGAGLSARGSISLAEGGGLRAATFDRVRYGGWLDAPVTLTGRGAGRPPAIAVAGGTIDLGRMVLGSGGTGQGGGAPISVQLDSLTVSEGISLTGFRGEFGSSGGFNGRFTARVNGVGQIAGTVVPAPNGSAVRITSEDAGRVMASAGLFANARGGTLQLQLVPTGGKGRYAGTASVRNLRVINAPVLAELLSAISVIGILEQLNGAGLVFGEAEAEFRLTPDLIEVTRGSAVGASLGVSMAGIYETQGKRLDMRGVISPIYMLNGIGAVLTRRGEGLFGFNYRLHGTSERPRVEVNPLSILTPGMFREIFRTAPPTAGAGN
ncbi:hypothetical protein E7811_00110 [Aliigemmobacter aestuarii]|uniref:DUF3971 domain-containing protein n=1 Tax=Aliigemmobacter aestuarii TaxID=1445661 RepID=A0A4S3MW03_9RHOB|nr:hypothetical protein E7811_00110 [Gemmobacter aestuarii]